MRLVMFAVGLLLLVACRGSAGADTSTEVVDNDGDGFAHEGRLRRR